MDPVTLRELADLRRKIDLARGAAGRTFDAMTMARAQAPAAAAATPFLASCAQELEALAGLCRAAAEAGATPAVQRAD